MGEFLSIKVPTDDFDELVRLVVNHICNQYPGGDYYKGQIFDGLSCDGAKIFAVGVGDCWQKLAMHPDDPVGILYILEQRNNEAPDMSKPIWQDIIREISVNELLRHGNRSLDQELGFPTPSSTQPDNSTTPPLTPKGSDG